MPFPALEHRRGALRDVDADLILLVVPAVPPEGEPLEPDTWSGLVDALRRLGFAGAAGTTVRVALDGLDRPLAVVGAGAEPSAAVVRDAVGTAFRTLTGFATIAVGFAGVDDGLWRAAAEGAALGGYRFQGYRAGGPARRADLAVMVADVDVEASALAEVSATAAAVALVKDLVATPAEWLGPADLAARATAEVADLPVSVTVLDERRLVDEGYGGISGVGQGSDRPPRLVVLDYAPEGAAVHVSLVGKGITFDTGGLSLKPAASMLGMKYDMCGAATVLAVLKAVATLRWPVHVTARLCLADNMPSGRAIRPGDVLRQLDGTTVEVTNTDAEGRLVLADGLVAASRERPDLLVDVATLTGAVSVALGTRHMGVMGDDAARERFLDAAREADEGAWPLPLPAHMRDDLDSPIADLQNAKVGDTAGGALFAGLFLQHFVGPSSDAGDAPRIPWVHLDIAGVGMNKGGGHGFTDKGPTGASVRSLLRLIAASRVSPAPGSGPQVPVPPRGGSLS